MKVQILQHLAMGDHIICNGLVRKQLEFYDQIELFTTKRHLDSVRWMYRDEERINVICVQDANDARERFNDQYDHLIVGFENLKIESCHFDEAAYNCVGVDFSLRWSHFHYVRDKDSEQECLDSFKLSGDDYVIVHEDPIRNFIIDRTLLPQDKKVIYLKPLKNNKGNYCRIFDYLLLLERASEIHCIDSSFRCLIESFDVFQNSKLYFHDYARDNSEEYNITEAKSWKRLSPCKSYEKWRNRMEFRSWFLMRWDRVKNRL